MKKLIGSPLLIVIASLFVGPSVYGQMTLTEQLKAKAEASKAKGDSEKSRIMQKAIQEVEDSKLTKKAVKKGDKLPAFTLPDVKRGRVSSKELLKKGPLVLTFYRGGWCPYCNLQLRDLQKHLPDIEAAGGTLVAISPQVPDKSLSTAEKAELTFYVLSDVGNKVARAFGLVYTLPDDLIALYKEFGLDLAASNGTADWELPLAATYVVKPNGKIVYSFLDSDYKKRAETLEIIKVLKKLK